MARESGEPIFITNKGEADGVYMRIEAYEEREKMLAHRASILAAEAARLGPLHPDPELAALGYRKLVRTKTYVAIYQVIDDTVAIYPLVSGKTDYPKPLK